MKTILNALAICGLVIGGVNTVSAQTSVESFGESVICTLLERTLKLPLSLCVIAKKEFVVDLKRTTLSLKSQRYCGTSNFSAARQMFNLNDRNSMKCATVLAVSCELYRTGC